MRSMTGFGRGEATNGEVTVAAELRAVNNRFRDVQVRVPREYNVLEPRITTLLRDGVQRGRIDATVRRTSADGDARIRVDLGVVDQYQRAAAAIAARTGQDSSTIPVATLLTLPGVVTTADSEPDALAEWALVEVAVGAALEELAAMRSREGEALAIDLRKHLLELDRLRREVESVGAGLVDRVQARLTERIHRLVAERADPARLASEAALLADKADVSEELARLGSHIEQFGAALASDEPVGRRLDFLLQEIHREVNTLGSKAAEQAVSSRVVEMKSLVERLREQAANVE